MISVTKILSLALATATAVTAGLTAIEVGAQIDILTGKWSDLQGPCNSITESNTYISEFSYRPFLEIISSFNEVITYTSYCNAQFIGCQPYYAPGDEEIILQAYVKLVEIHQTILQILVEKAELCIEISFFIELIVGSLYNLETYIDTFSFTLIDLIPNQAPACRNQKSVLDGCIKGAITKYNGI